MNAGEHQLPGTVDRRRLLKGFLAGAGGVALGTVVPGAFPAVASAATAPTLAAFQKQLGKQFRCRSGARTATLVLKSAAALPHDPSLIGSGFVLTFTGAGTGLLPSATATISNSAVSTLVAFLTPVNRPGSVQTYTVVIDQRRPMLRMPIPVRGV